MINIVKNHNTDRAKVQYLIDYVYAEGGIDYSTQVMHAYLAEAESVLHNFEDSPAKKSLLELMRYTVKRKK